MAHIYRTTTESVAEELSKLTWFEMRKLATNLADIISSGERNAENPIELADVLAEWAESENDSYHARCQESAS